MQKTKEISQTQIKEIQRRVVKGELKSEDCDLLDQILTHLLELLTILENQTITLAKLRQMVFGKSYKTKQLSDVPAEIGTDKSGDIAGSQDEATTGQEHNAADLPTTVTTENPHPDNTQPKKVIKGHGRISKDSYADAQTISCGKHQYPIGERCKFCDCGNFYSIPQSTIQIDGSAPLFATRYEYHNLRCSGCGIVIKPTLPATLQSGKYTSKAKAVLAVTHYIGTPFHRLAMLQKMVNTPVPVGTQWEQVEDLANAALPVFRSMRKVAAQAQLIHQDDTGVRILSCIKENKTSLEQEQRQGMYSTGIVAIVGERVIVLYISGRQHAGENLDDLLDLRQPDKGSFTKVSDGLSCNNTQRNTDYLKGGCNSHAIRKFIEIDEFFPQECAYVRSVFKTIYHNDEHCKTGKLSPEERLKYHQEHSQPSMEKLKSFLEEQFEKKLAEPNGNLGKAYAYLLNNWNELTLFLRQAGTPLDNNITERVLKKMIILRKNSFFFKTEHGAYIGSMLTSLIATCQYAKVNPVDYFVSLLDYRKEVCKKPDDWLPWNYQQTLSRINSQGEIPLAA